MASPVRGEATSAKFGVRFVDVTKDYGGVIAVDHLDLDIVDGEFLVLLGPSGCGKTTALRMIAGLEDITDGKLFIGDRLVNDVAPGNRNVAMVFQSYALYPHQSVAKNIASPLTVREYAVEGESQPRKLNRSERDLRVAMAAQMLDLTDYLDRKPGALSGGQRQRVALARAIVARPHVFLMDEPLSNLDAKLRTQTRAQLVDLHRKLKTTIVYVTHDQVEAMTMASRIAVMSQGHLQQVGSPEAVYDTPANLFVAKFIGTPPMNTMDARVSERGTHVELLMSPQDGFGGRFRLSDGHQAILRPGADVVVGIRPEHFVLSAESSSEDEGIVGKVHNVEWLGHEVVVAVDVGEALIAVRQGVEAVQPDLGMGVKLTAEPAKVHLFDPDTSLRLS